MPLLQIVIDFSGITQSTFETPFGVAAFVFIRGGWIILIPLLLWALWEGWLLYIQNKYAATIKYILLAIDVPKLNEQSPKAVEQVFAHLSGIQKRGNLIERYIHGFFQPSFSLELVSIGGYIQFIIRTPAQLRDLVEAAVYAQYPDAEISQIDDYVPAIKPEFPNEHDIWGTELELYNKTPYPIRTYPSFEHPLSQKFLDPISSLLEIMSRLGPDEQVWIQIIITPTLDYEWRQQGQRIIKKLIGARVQAPSGGLLTYPGKVATGVFETLTATLITPGEATARQRTEPPSLMQHIPPHERSIIESIGIKISKIGFLTKFRFVYFAKKESFHRTRIPAIMGAIKQYNTLDMNGFRPNRNTKTTANYFFVNYRLRHRKRRLYWGFRYRSMKRGYSKYVLNTEELASLYHFPVVDVKAPLVKKTESKKGEPPVSLPVAPIPFESTETETKLWT